MPFDPLTPEERETELTRARPRRSLPIAPRARPGARRLPLAPEARDVDRRWRPAYAVWEVTLACDLACRHCGSRAGHERPDELTTAEALDLIAQMAELGVPEVTLIGGEAYLREDWLVLVRALATRGIVVNMTTGGRGLTREKLLAAKEAGLAAIGVSIDGDEAVHDRLRGVVGSYRAAFETMRIARELGMHVSCNTQVNRLSIPHMPDILARIAALGLHSWQIQLTVPMGRAADEPEVLVQPYDMLALFPLLAELKEVCVAKNVNLWTGNNIGYFGPYESALRGHYPFGRGGQCGAGRGSLGIEANGAIKGCPSLPTAEYVGGNVRDDRLRDIWERAAALRVTRDRTVDDLWGFCRTCYYAEDCMAGCMWTAHSYFGRPGNNPFCHHRALEMARAGKRERVVRQAPAPGEPFDHGLFELVEEDLSIA
jgi:radical SAM protein with 4Fe4S-binding SPASM domain